MPSLRRVSMHDSLRKRLNLQAFFPRITEKIKLFNRKKSTPKTELVRALAFFCIFRMFASRDLYPFGFKSLPAHLLLLLTILEGYISSGYCCSTR
jgi:hypothetical protein